MQTLKIKADNLILTWFVPSIKIKIGFPLPFYPLFPPSCLIRMTETPLLTFLLNFFASNSYSLALLRDEQSLKGLILDQFKGG